MFEHSEFIPDEPEHVDDTALLASTYIRYAMVGGCALATIACMPQEELKPSLPDDLDPRQSVDAIRFWYQTSQISAKATPPAAWTASSNYLDRLAIQNLDLAERLNKMGSEQTVEGFRHIFGALIKQSFDPAAQSAVETDKYDALLAFFMEDVLAINSLGLPDPAAKAAFAPPEQYAQTQQAPEKKEIETFPNSSSQSAYFTVDSYDQYLQDVAQHTVPNKEETIDLAQKIEAGVLAQAKLDEATDLSDRDKQDLATLTVIGQQAKQRMIEGNLRLVLKFALPYRQRVTKEIFLDLVQEGNAGLMHAVEMFDYQKGFAFSTYASRWIRSAILAHKHEQSMPVHLSFNTHIQKNKITAFVAEHSAEHGTPPTMEQIAKVAGASLQQAEDLLEASKYTFSTIESPFGFEGGTLGEVLLDSHEADVHDIAFGNSHAINEALETIFSDDTTNHYAAILILHFGLPLNPAFISSELVQRHNVQEGLPYKITEVGNMLGISRDAARIRRNRALEILRNPELTPLLFGK